MTSFVNSPLYWYKGGPLFVASSDEADTDTFTQIGIVSYGYGCASRYPGVYTRVDRSDIKMILDKSRNYSFYQVYKVDQGSNDVN